MTSSVSFGWQADALRLSADLSAVAPRGAAEAKADVAQLAERVLGKDEVTSSILVIGSSLRSRVRERLRELRLASAAKADGRRSATERAKADRQ